ncbi:hydrogen peroxide-inducible genes activator [Corynebacterium sp. 320]|uniref:Probable hydrogen peroxide-inducible genes activator n=1 Tax=Corynebacterium zhongnanshanii TaxID=2768834 RepID=A0ABQ6VG61_9CORY|nr:MULTISPECIES: hydrogen peroxide-inducible genes activator [Corynebacterium]KAB1503754.1 hydrogen peroxide-inducible genes activator [Corynebacterium sp. 320]KAB1553146.1 hydrogen peroxide-inducible genes activator [Corynebacterium sp. 321]KAB1553636.1 hydrogen peroxide-inducible genes activator [Corynebacterium sp. 319]KAB3523395.1 hydrogen peroxide-inducible genes activator [Corynebacterium zhongnanshanii]KAB3527890.1 hydrogen peroxide-inducible genes activator [Corynebacterium sp. 250]
MSPREYRPTISQLRTFTTIAETGHFGTAAIQLGISQPSLSQGLNALEMGLGAQLIERSTRRVIVTPVGRSLLPHARATLDSLDCLVALAKGGHGALIGEFTVGIIPTIAPFILPGFLKRLPSEAPDLQPHIIEGQTSSLSDSLRQGKIDVAIIAGGEDVKGLDSTELYTEEFVLIVPSSSPLAGRRDVSVRELEALDLLLLDEGHCLRDQVLNICRRAELSTNPQHDRTRAAGLSTIVQMVAAGLGSTLIPLSAVEAECQRPGLGIATIKGGARTASRTVELVYRNSSVQVEEFRALGRILENTYHDVVTRSREIVERSVMAPRR